MQLIDLKKQKFGRLTVIEYKGTSMWLCKCDCGKVTTVFRNNLVSGNTKSCGCLQLETLEKGRQGTHGMTDTRFYKIWRNLNQRCYLKSNIRFKFYGEKGIKCLWKSFEDFRDDMYESYLKHEKEFGTKQTTIDRIDNDGHYCKENCKWSNTSEQARNKNNNRLLTFKGNTKCVTEWSEILNISRVVIFSRLRLGWSINKILTTPIKN